MFGSLNVDLIFPVDALPGPGQTVLASGLATEAGGKGANQACAAARDGAAVAMAGAVGTDPLADVATAGLAASGVDLSRLARVPGQTGCAAICTDGAGRNQIVVGPGANAAARGTAVEDALLGPAAIVVTQMEVDPAETSLLIRRAHAAGARIVHNLAPARPMDADALRLVGVLVVNEDEAAWLARFLGVAGPDAAALHAALGAVVVRTLGGDGVEWCGPDDAGHVPARPVEAKDTTAAGDCFVGVLAAALDRGEALRPAILRANVAASISCTRPGSQRSLPTRTETDAALRTP